MRISDLLGSEVVAADGTSYGKVREVRCVQDGPVRGGVQAAWRVDALLGVVEGCRSNMLLEYLKSILLYGWS